MLALLPFPLRSFDVLSDFYKFQTMHFSRDLGIYRRFGDYLVQAVRAPQYRPAVSLPTRIPHPVSASSLRSIHRAMSSRVVLRQRWGDSGRSRCGCGCRMRLGADAGHCAPSSRPRCRLPSGPHGPNHRPIPHFTLQTPRLACYSSRLRLRLPGSPTLLSLRRELYRAHRR